MSLTHWLVVIVIALLLFGRGKISDMMGDLAKGIKSFKKGMADDDDVAKGEPAKKDEPPKVIESAAKSAAPVEANKAGWGSKA
jgi:sec-independent protein translocase protein TatA